MTGASKALTQEIISLALNKPMSMLTDKEIEIGTKIFEYTKGNSELVFTADNAHAIEALKEVVERRGVPWAAFLSPRRDADINEVRQMTYFFLVNELDVRKSHIPKFLGILRTNASILHALDYFTQRLQSDKMLSKRYNAFVKEVIEIMGKEM